MKAIVALAVCVVVCAGAGAAWLLSSDSANIHSAAAPQADAVTLDVEWFIGDGELVLGTDRLRIPLGMNVQLLIDSDALHTLTITDYGVQSELLPDQVTPVHFHAYELGTHSIMLDGQERPIGIMEVFEKGSI